MIGKTCKKLGTILDTLAPLGPLGLGMLSHPGYGPVNHGIIFRPISVICVVFNTTSLFDPG